MVSSTALTVRIDLPGIPGLPLPFAAAAPHFAVGAGTVPLSTLVEFVREPCLLHSGLAKVLSHRQSKARLRLSPWDHPCHLVVARLRPGRRHVLREKHWRASSALVGIPSCK